GIACRRRGKRSDHSRRDKSLQRDRRRLQRKNRYANRTELMTIQTELPEMPSVTAEADPTNRTLPGGVTVVLERCETATRAGMRRFLQLRAYCETYRGGIKEVSMRTEDNPASRNFELYLDLVCREVRREIEGLTQSHSEKPLLVLKRRPHTLREF